MKKTVTHFIFGTSILALINACDVSDGVGGGSGGGDPVVIDFPIAYIERPTPVGFEDDDDVQMSVIPDDAMNPIETRPGAKLILRDRASFSADTRVLTEGIFPQVMNMDGEMVEPDYDVRDLNINEDGTKLAFSMRAPINPNDDDDDPDQPKWNIWEYDLLEDTLTPLLPESERERGHDRFPAYLPDDSIVFSSTRQSRSRALSLSMAAGGFKYVTELDDDRVTFTLHVINDDRDAISQVSYGRGHDLHPTVLEDGRILFLRNDNSSARGANRNRLSMYTMNPDGSNVSLHYGFHSDSSEEENGDDDTPAQGALLKPVQLEDGNILVHFRPRETRVHGGDIVSVDTANYIDNTQPTDANVGGTGPAENSLSAGTVSLETQSLDGYFNSAYPMYDGTGRLLISWMGCLVQAYNLDGVYVRRIDPEEEDDPVQYVLINTAGQFVDEDGDVLDDGETPVEINEDEIITVQCEPSTFNNPQINTANPQYNIWVYDPARDTHTPVVLSTEIGTMYTDAVVFAPRLTSDIIPPAVQDQFDVDLANANLGIIHIRSVYDIDGVDRSPAGSIAAMANPETTAADDRPIRFVRFYAEAYMPHEDDLEIDNDIIRGRVGQPARTIIGYAQVHPDGSVMATVPADTSFSMEFLDREGHRVTGTFGGRHDYWLNVRPGETRTCNGCHSRTSLAPHGRADAEPASQNSGAAGGVNFPGTALTTPLGAPFPAPEVGETMAEYYVRSKLSLTGDDATDPLALSVDLTYTDEWTDLAIVGTVEGEPINIPYGNTDRSDPNPRVDIVFSIDPDSGEEVVSYPINLTTEPPTNFASCLSEWAQECRIIINYEEHIQPIFEVNRQHTDSAGTVTNITCTNCHSTTDSEGNDQVPEPSNLQLDFRGGISPFDPAIYTISYDNLFLQTDAADDPRYLLYDLDGDNLVNREDPVFIGGVPQFEQTAQLDADGDPTFEFTDLLDNTVCVSQEDGDADVDLTQVFTTDDPPETVPCERTLCTTDPDSGLEIFSDDNANGVIDEGECVTPVPVTVFVDKPRYFNNQGANSGLNQGFFNAFNVGTGAPDHRSFLTPTELKLFAEWLDQGGQYTNNVLDAVE